MSTYTPTTNLVVPSLLVVLGCVTNDSPATQTISSVDASMQRSTNGLRFVMSFEVTLGPALFAVVVRTVYRCFTVFYLARVTHLAGEEPAVTGVHH